MNNITLSNSSISGNIQIGDHNQTHIAVKTDGGALIHGNVVTGRDFVGRDQHITDNESLRDKIQAEKREYNELLSLSTILCQVRTSNTFLGSIIQLFIGVLVHKT